MITVLTVDAVAGIDREKALGIGEKTFGDKANYACAPYKNTIEALVDFFDRFEAAATGTSGGNTSGGGGDDGRSGGGDDGRSVITYPLELVSGRRDVDALTTKLARAFLNKSGARFEHMAMAIGGNPHDAFEDDISTGRRVDGTLEAAIARAAGLNDPARFERIAKGAFPGSLSFRLVTGGIV